MAGMAVVLPLSRPAQDVTVATPPGPTAPKRAWRAVRAVVTLSGVNAAHLKFFGTSSTEAEKPGSVDDLDAQISSLLESLEADVRAAAIDAPGLVKEAAPPRRPAREAAPPRRRRRPRRHFAGSKPTTSRPVVRKQTKEAVVDGKPPTFVKAVQTRRTAAKARVLAPHRAPTRARRPFLADPATRELAYFILAGLLIGAFVGLVVALSG
jgi:hypothetical protein